MDTPGTAKSQSFRLEQPRIENAEPRLIAGLQERFTAQTRQHDIPLLWTRFIPHIGKVPGQVAQVAYGVCSHLVSQPFSFEYLAGVEVSTGSAWPQGFSQTTLPPSLYAIFRHREHVSQLPVTLDAIHQKWLPDSLYKPAHGAPAQPYLIERYGEGFNPATGMGDIEIWIPVERKI